MPGLLLILDDDERDVRLRLEQAYHQMKVIGPVITWIDNLEKTRWESRS
jgi:hypothetical protein